MSRQGRRQETIKGSWTEAEDKRLTFIVKSSGNLNWSNVADEMKGRSAKQCRERWVQNLRPDLEHEPINEMEGIFIMEQVERLGKKWAEIARRLECDTGRIRSDNNVKNWYNGTVNRQNRAERRREASALLRHNATAAAAAAAAAGAAATTLARPSTSFSSSYRSRSARPMPPQQLTLADQRELPPPMSASASDLALASPTSALGYYGEVRHQHPLSHAAPIHASYNNTPALPLQRQPSVHQLPPLQDALRYSVSDREFERQWPQQTHYTQRLPERRPSVYTLAGSPQSDRHCVPSLMSDTGSPPSARDSPTHAPASPNAVVSTILPPLAAMDGQDRKGYAAYSLPLTANRSWSGQSDDLQLYSSRPSVLMEPRVVVPRPSSSSRGSSSFAIAHLLN
ncbi:hypothetical protein SEPCBS119000_002312 [Sporothrix epigloea]|uniref:Uncharacterized protein n=1 Tax=Sporothrix epigloea TaxID=1892477 RepID=A0ABP0DHA2_9PEZI